MRIGALPVRVLGVACHEELGRSQLDVARSNRSAKVPCTESARTRDSQLGHEGTPAERGERLPARTRVELFARRQALRVPGAAANLCAPDAAHRSVVVKPLVSIVSVLRIWAAVKHLRGVAAPA